ncbi:MAG: phosphotransferase [Oligoflexia bacterium]|nr:phosphotransferase [Oligoflexia bacterium]
MSMDINSMIDMNFKQKVRDTFGATGDAWLQRLPAIVTKYADLWKINLIRTVVNLSHNFIMYATDAHNVKVILKIGIPSKSLESEIIALIAYDGNGCVKLLEYDLDDGVMLLEDAEMGMNLSELTLSGRDEEAVRIVVEIIEKLNLKNSPATVPATIAAHQNNQNSKRADVTNLASFAQVEDWLHGFKELHMHLVSEKTDGLFSVEIAERAEKEYCQLLSSSNKRVLLHGDLHHSNILWGKRGPWVAIDPKGVWGDPVFEVAAFTRNPVHDLLDLGGHNLKMLTKRRIELFSRYLSMDTNRIWSVSFAQAVLAGWWYYQDHKQACSTWNKMAEVFLAIE